MAILPQIRENFEQIQEDFGRSLPASAQSLPRSVARLQSGLHFGSRRKHFGTCLCGFRHTKCSFTLCRNWFGVHTEMRKAHTHTQTLLVVQMRDHRLPKIECNEKPKSRRHMVSATDLFICLFISSSWIGYRIQLADTMF